VEVFFQPLKCAAANPLEELTLPQGVVILSEAKDLSEV
jgi:hypothetical protein